VLRAGRQTETTQEYIQDCLELDEGDPGFQLLTEEEIAAVIFYYFHQHYVHYYIPHLFVFYVFYLSFRAIFCLINSDDLSAS
jgi:hypothetical protein